MQVPDQVDDTVQEMDAADGRVMTSSISARLIYWFGYRVGRRIGQSS